MDTFAVELIDNVISFFDSRSDLVHFARVCKTWKEPSLRRLWRKFSKGRDLCTALEAFVVPGTDGLQVR